MQPFCVRPPVITNTTPRFEELVPRFLRFIEVERQFARQSVLKYEDCLRQIVRMLGDRPITAYAAEDITELKAALLARNLSVARQVSILSALKGFLNFCCQQCGYQVLPPEAVAIPKRPRREVIYLTVEEVHSFLAAIPLDTQRGQPHLPGLRFRALVEVLLGTAMRISEALSLNREDVDFERREARIVGKGNKQRTVFFTVRATEWLTRYLKQRTDSHSPLFLTFGNKTRLKREDIWRPFLLYRRRAGINKPVTPHLLRHTAATQLLFNGCPIGHIKEILGHERLETTCRYYLGLDRRAAKQAHGRYLIYETSAPGGTTDVED